MVSLSLPPSMVSLPSPPLIVSLPSDPSKVSLFLEPINKSFPLPPKAVIPSVVLSATLKNMSFDTVVICSLWPSLSV